jgi:hypothetical protein
LTLSIILSIIAVLGTLGGALGGTWLGVWLKQGADDRAWYRQQRLEAYLELMTACDSVMHAAYDVYEEGGPPPDVAKADLLDKVAALHRAGDRVKLLGSLKVMGIIDNVLLYCGDTLTRQALEWPHVSGVEWMRVTQERDNMYHSLLYLAQSDLLREGKEEHISVRALTRRMKRTRRLKRISGN